jgi:hypothetical protein
VLGFLLLVIASGNLVLAQEGNGTKPKNGSIEEALSRFLTAFDNLDWPSFRSCFSSTATIFHPAVPNVKRIDSPDQFERAWLGVFERFENPPVVLLPLS